MSSPSSRLADCQRALSHAQSEARNEVILLRSGLYLLFCKPSYQPPQPWELVDGWELTRILNGAEGGRAGLSLGRKSLAHAGRDRFSGTLATGTRFFKLEFPSHTVGQVKIPKRVPPRPPEPILSHWVEFTWLDAEGNPLSGVEYKITLPDGQVREGLSSSDGRAYIDGIAQPGDCLLEFFEDGEWVSKTLKIQAQPQISE